MDTGMIIGPNVGGRDRRVRAIISGILAVVGTTILATRSARAGYGVLALAGAAGLLFNVLSRRCLANHLLGIDTRRR